MQEKLKLVITNNPSVKNYYDAETDLDYELMFVDTKEDVFIKTRNLIHKSWCLLNHTLVANIPVYKHPYRTLAVKKSTELDEFSLSLIETAIEQLSRGEQPNYNEKALKDFQDLDFILFREVKI